jgi:hypothetical protein
MPRSIPSGLAAAFAGGDADHLTAIFTLTRVSGEVTRFTTAQHAFTHANGHVYEPAPGLRIGAVDLKANEAAGTLPIGFVGEADGMFDFSDVLNGAFDGAEILYDVVNRKAPASGSIRIFRGWLGEIALSGRSGEVSTEARGLLHRTKFLVTEPYTPVCRAYLGDHRCRVPIYPDDVTRGTAYAVGPHVRARQDDAGLPADYGNLIWRCTTAGTTAATAPDYSGKGVGDTVTDGDAVFTAEDSYIRHAQIVSVDGFNVTVEGVATPRISFELGAILGMTGKNKGRAIEIKAWDQDTLTANCFQRPELVFAVGDWVELIPGCDYTLGEFGCAKYDNVKNSRIHNLVPGEDVINADYRVWGS